MDLISNIAEDMELNEKIERKRHHHKVSSVREAIQNEDEAEEEASIAQQEFLQAKTRK